MRVFNELHVQLVEVSCDINALQLRIVELVDKDEVRVDLNPAILSHSETNLVALLCLIV